MSIDPIKLEVRNLLAFIDLEIRDAECALAEGAPQGRVHAAGELVRLRKRKAELTARLDELEHASDGAASTFIQWVKESGMILAQTFETWLEAG
jgi:hypothetical protein